MRRLLRYRPSPALVISCIALFLAMGGVSWALATGSITTREIKNSTIRSRDIHNRTIRGKDVHRNTLTGSRVRESTLGTVPRADGVNRYAVVSSAGIVARSRGLSSAVRTSAGHYQAIFNRDVRGCAYVATLGSVGATGPTNGEVSVASLASNVNGVSVRTANSNGTATNRSFHLIVNC
ncbi:MAG: hypothetical protein ABR581_04555 [Thermoleophilaceae bacterium]